MPSHSSQFSYYSLTQSHSLTTHQLLTHAHSSVDLHSSASVTGDRLYSSASFTSDSSVSFTLCLKRFITLKVKWIK
ncbi:hypothetical protein P8452_50389 [Trifolium repens]|nr:hypothetical protein P8452_50389 [Trifolium repens]